MTESMQHVPQLLFAAASYYARFKFTINKQVI